MSGVVRLARPSPADIAAVRALAPLAADLTMRCGPFSVPAAVVASAPTLEENDSEEAQVARGFIEGDPWHGMGSVHPGGWMLLARDDDTIVLGQREGQVGLGAVVELRLREGVFAAVRMGGWQLESSDPSERVEVCFNAQISGKTVTVPWTSGKGHGGGPTRVTSRVRLLESKAEVHFMMYSRPARPPTDPQSNDVQSQNSVWVDSGRSVTTSFDLRAPLGDRPLLHNHRIPPVLVEPTASFQTRRRV